MNMRTIQFNGLTDHVFFNLGIRVFSGPYGKETSLYALTDTIKKVPKENNVYLSKTNEVCVRTLAGTKVIGHLIEDGDWKKLLKEKYIEWRNNLPNRDELHYDFPQYAITGKRLPYHKLSKHTSDAPARASEMHLHDLCGLILPYRTEIIRGDKTLQIYFMHPQEIGKMHAKLLVEIPISEYITATNSSRIKFIKSLLIVTYDKVEEAQEEVKELTWYQ